MDGSNVKIHMNLDGIVLRCRRCEKSLSGEAWFGEAELDDQDAEPVVARMKRFLDIHAFCGRTEVKTWPAKS
jgi:hypothetical protein